MDSRCAARRVAGPHKVRPTAAWLIPSIACAIVAVAHVSAGAQQPTKANVPDITGSWDRYRSAPRAAGGAQQPDPYAPPQAPPPPLKPQYLKERQAALQAAREADA